jgi:hypothetical protein
MNPNKASKHVRNWFASVTKNDPPLLEVRSDGVTPIVSAGLPIRLCCSQQLLNTVASMAAVIIADWEGSRVIEGISYCVYRRNSNGDPDPLYVGIANSSNKKGNKISSLWRMRAARFCDNYDSNGHVDCLSRSLFDGYKGYSNWATTLFGTVPAPGILVAPQLLQPVFVHFELWNSNAKRILPEVPDAPLYVEEMNRLWTLKSAGYGPQLLNRDGN